MEVIHLTPAEAMFTWPRLEPLIQQALEHTDGEMSLSDFKAFLAAGILTCLVAYEGKEIYACSILEIVDYPQFRILRMAIVAGREIEKWEHFEAEIERLAIEKGCSYVEGLARPGLAKRGLRHGYKQRYVVVRKRILGGLQ